LSWHNHYCSQIFTPASQHIERGNRKKSLSSAGGNFKTPGETSGLP
jgi:hypothetical protein